MAINTTTYSGKQFKIFYAQDSAVGTFNTDDADYFQLDVDNFVMPTFNPTLDFEMRTGDGRVATENAVFASEKGIVREFTIQGRLTHNDATILLQNVTSTAAASEKITLGTGFSPSNIAHGDTITDAGTTLANDLTGVSQTLSFYFEAPDMAYKLAGCVCTNLQLSAEMGSDSARWIYTATFQTGYTPAKGTITMTDFAAIDTNKLFLSDMIDKKIAGIDDALLSGITITFDNPTEFLGQQGGDGEPELIARAVGEFGISYDATIKYDSETNPLFEGFRNGESMMFYLGMAAETYSVQTTLSARLNGAITRTATTSIPVSDVVTDGSAPDPADDSYLLLGKEIVQVTSGSGSSSWTLKRGIDTAKSAHADDTPFYLITGTPPFATPAAGSNTGLSFDFNTTKLTSIELDTGDIAQLNISGKVLDDGTNNVATILIDFT